MESNLQKAAKLRQVMDTLKCAEDWHNALSNDRKSY